MRQVEFFLYHAIVFLLLKVLVVLINCFAVVSTYYWPGVPRCSWIKSGFYCPARKDWQSVSCCFCLSSFPFHCVFFNSRFFSFLLLFNIFFSSFLRISVQSPFISHAFLTLRFAHFASHFSKFSQWIFPFLFFFSISFFIHSFPPYCFHPLFSRSLILTRI